MDENKNKRDGHKRFQAFIDTIFIKMDQLSIYLGKVIKKEKRYEDNNNQSEIDTKNSNQSEINTKNNNQSEINTKNSNQSEIDTKNNNQSEDKDQGKPIEWGVGLFIIFLVIMLGNEGHKWRAMQKKHVLYEFWGKRRETGMAEDCQGYGQGVYDEYLDSDFADMHYAVMLHARYIGDQCERYNKGKPGIRQTKEQTALGCEKYKEQQFRKYKNKLHEIYIDEYADELQDFVDEKLKEYPDLGDYVANMDKLALRNKVYEDFKNKREK